MEDYINLFRFIEAHERSYQTALREIQNGRKCSHWMWYIFPQIHGLGKSPTSQYYAIRDLEEAAAFLEDPFLGGNLQEICAELLKAKTDDPTEIFGKPDDQKLRSCMTLFAHVPGASIVFQQVLDKFYNGRQDMRTLKILGL